MYGMYKRDRRGRIACIMSAGRIACGQGGFARAGSSPTRWTTQMRSTDLRIIFTSARRTLRVFCKALRTRNQFFRWRRLHKFDSPRGLLGWAWAWAKVDKQEGGRSLCLLDADRCYLNVILAAMPMTVHQSTAIFAWRGALLSISQFGVTGSDCECLT